MRTSRISSTNVLFAPATLAEAQRCGHVRRVGPSFISLASRNGQQTMALLWPNSETRKGSFHHSDNGGVLAAIYQKMTYLSITRVGVRKNSTQDPPPVYRRIHADSRVASLGYCRGSVRTLARWYAMPAHVNPAHIWGLWRAAFAAKRLHPSGVSTLNTALAGVVVSYVAI